MFLKIITLTLKQCPIYNCLLVASAVDHIKIKNFPSFKKKRKLNYMSVF